jgi:hypothetical protein
MPVRENVDFNFGKLLIVNQRSTTGKAEIKRLTKSKKVVELKDKRNGSSEVRFLHLTLEIGLRNIGIECHSLKIYQLDDDAVSTMYALADDSFIRAIIMDDAICEKIGLANEAVTMVEDIRQHIDLEGIEYNYEMNQLIRRTKYFKTDGLDIEIKKLSTIGSSVLNPAKKMLEDLLSTKW